MIIDDGMIAAMTDVGHHTEKGECYVAEIMIAAQSMQAGLSQLKLYLKQGSLMTTGRMVMGTVKGDLQDIGKNLVVMMLDGAGFEVIDLGVDVKPVTFVGAVRQHKPDIDGMGALFTTTMGHFRTKIQALQAAGSFEAIRDSFRQTARSLPDVEAQRHETTDTYAVDGTDLTAPRLGPQPPAGVVTDLPRRRLTGSLQNAGPASQENSR